MFSRYFVAFLKKKHFCLLFLLTCCPAIDSIPETQDNLCCWETSGSCRTTCEQISLVKITGDGELKKESLISLRNFCSHQLTSFWDCVNDTLAKLERGKEWPGRRCCFLPQSAKCQRACVTASSRRDLKRNCRKSDETLFFACLDKQELGDECCANARSGDCLAACKMVFQSSGTSIRELRDGVMEYCGDTSPMVVNCIKNFTKLTPVTNADKFLDCCNASDDVKCKETCKNILNTKSTGQEIMDGLQEGNCGPPLPQKKFWQCFLRAGESPPIDSSSASARIDQMGLDSAKLYCCSKAITNVCRRLCVKAFSDEWAGTWKEFERECLFLASEEKLFHCIEEVEEPCELGCDGLSYCTNFNNRPIEFFRSCNALADDAARYDVALWQQQGFLDLPGGIQILVKNVSECLPDTWKAVACALQVKPCHTQTHANGICSEDCYEMLSRCIDWSRMAPGQRAEVICSKLSSEKLLGSCISLKPFLVPSDHPYSRTEPGVTTPCRGDPCDSDKLCLINRNCPPGKKCQPYSCVTGCKMGEVSQYMIPSDSYVRISIPTENKICQKICRCSRHGIMEQCQPLPCVFSDNCWLGNKRINHGSTFWVDCNICSCLSGEITCSKRQCPTRESKFEFSSFTTLPCNCLLHYVPVCGKNGNTYHNACLAKCAGLKDADFDFGPCSARNGCEPNPCGEGFKCVSIRKVCLSALEKPCKQYICVDVTLNCEEMPMEPMCDTEQNEHFNLCSLVKAGKTLAYRSSCLSDCVSEGLVCGIDGETYPSQCSAMVNMVKVDYEGACIAVGAISGEPKAQCGSAIACPGLPHEGCHAVTPTGACCPICAGALRILYSRKQTDRALYALRGTPTSALTVLAILTSLQRHIQVSECSLWGYLTVESDIFVVVAPRPSVKKASQLLKELCVKEAEKLAILIQTSSPRMMSDLGLSTLTAATVVHVFVSSALRMQPFFFSILLLITSYM